MMKMDCTCNQKVHTAPVKCIEVSDGAIEKTAEILKGYKRIFMVADENTYKAAGKRVEELLQNAGILSLIPLYSKVRRIQPTLMSEGF